MSRNSWIWILIIAFVLGGIGGVLLNRFVIPFASSLPGLSWVQKFESNSPVVINHYQQTQLNDGANFQDLGNQAATYTVGIYTPAPNTKFVGNGIIVSSDGMIITSKATLSSGNNYVVVTNDGTNFSAVVRALDPRSEIAILTISANNLPFAQFANAESLVASQRLIAIGRSNNAHAYGFNLEEVTQTVDNEQSLEHVFYSENLENTISLQSKPTVDFIGGPVINFDGKVIGMTNSSLGVVIGEDLQTAVSTFLQTGKITRPSLGIKYLNVSAELAALKNLPSAGILVTSVDAGSPAAAAGILNNDLVTTFDNQDLSGHNFEILFNLHAATAVPLTVIRNGNKVNLTVNLTSK